MSEFSQSYHLRTTDKEEVVSLLKASGKHGFVFEPVNGWVTFVVANSEFSVDEAVTEQTAGLLVHYVYAEDHGWELIIYNKNELVFDYKCLWEEELVIEADIFELDVIRELTLQQGNSAEDMESLFKFSDENELFAFEEHPAHQIADRLGIVHYAWVSPDYIGDDASLYQGVTEV
jgi:hypothetical protein